MSYYPKHRPQQQPLELRRSTVASATACGICEAPMTTHKPCSAFISSTHKPACDKCTRQHGGPDMLRRLQQLEQAYSRGGRGKTVYPKPEPPPKITKPTTPGSKLDYQKRYQQAEEDRSAAMKGGNRREADRLAVTMLQLKQEAHKKHGIQLH